MPSINMLGRYIFVLLDAVACDELRPLRDPAMADVEGWIELSVPLLPEALQRGFLLVSAGWRLRSTESACQREPPWRE